jgi:hypothetical protein
MQEQSSDSFRKGKSRLGLIVSVSLPLADKTVPRRGGRLKCMHVMMKLG